MAWLKYFVEVMFSLGLFINALLFVPQAIKLWKTKKADSVSLITFLGFNVIQLFTIIHAYLHQDYILFWGMVLTLLSCGSVVLLACMYKWAK